VPLDLDFDDSGNRDKLRWLVAQLLDLRPFWPRVVTLAIHWWGEQFRTEGAFGGTPWAPLSPAYAAWKAIHYPGRGILYREGDLRMAVSVPDREMTPTTLELTIPWARLKGEQVDVAWHQLGTQHMPPRPVIFGDPLPAQAALELTQAMDEYLDELIARAGL
jgi:hypothetical protein